MDGIEISDEITTPVYVKPLFPNEGNRFDIKNFSPTPLSIREKVLQHMKDALHFCDALILLDQVCEADTGVLTNDVREAICTFADQYPQKIVFADSRAFINEYRNVVIKCNNFEAARMTGRAENEFSESQVFDCMDELKAATHRPVVITCNAHGIAVESDCFKKLVPAVRHTCEIDIVGAGDACTAGMVTALCAGANFEEAAFIGNLSSGVTVRQLKQTGTASCAAMLALYDEQWPNEMTQ